MKQIRQRLTYANVMSSLAVFLILGGATAFAATKIGANQLKANSVKTGKIVKEAVTTSKLKNGSVSTSKLANDAVTGEKANESSFGQVPSAANALSLGGKAASEYSIRHFAKVNGTAANPTLAAGSPGVSVLSNRPFTGAATVHFPVDMTNCAVVATAITGGTSLFARQSGSLSEGNDVVIILENLSSAGTNGDFSVVGLC